MSILCIFLEHIIRQCYAYIDKGGLNMFNNVRVEVGLHLIGINGKNVILWVSQQFSDYTSALEYANRVKDEYSHLGTLHKLDLAIKSAA
jgi:hypothetical protein